MERYPEMVMYDVAEVEHVISFKATDYPVFSKQWHICVLMENEYENINEEDAFQLAEQLRKLKNGEDTHAMDNIKERFAEYAYRQPVAFRSTRERSFR